MIPSGGAPYEALEIVTMPTRTFRLHLSSLRLYDYVDEASAVVQAIFLILHTQRYEHVIYSYNYGVRLSDLFGRATSDVLPELERRITDALLYDDRILSVHSFVFEVKRSVVYCKFSAETVFGSVSADVDLSLMSYTKFQ